MTPRVIGLVGAGNWGRNILRDLRSLGAVVHVAERYPRSIESALSGGAESVVPEPESLPPSCEAFVVANRTIDHIEAVEHLLPRGRPIFVEKPLAADVAVARRLPGSAEHLVFVMHKWRYHPGIIALAEIAAREEFGPVRGLRTFRLNGEIGYNDVNPIWTLLPHDLSIALEILGEVPARVSAMPDPLTGLGQGLIARLSARNHSVSIVLEVSSGHVSRLRRFVLSCRDAVCELRDDRYNVIEIRRRDALTGSAPVERMVGSEMPLREELRAFLAFLDGGSPPKTAFPEELRLLEVIEGLQSSV